MNILFVCTLNKARSVTAERLYRRTPGMAVRSAGIDARAAHRVAEGDLLWADLVIVFEDQHRRWIQDTFAGDLPQIVDIGVPDVHVADAPALIAELRDGLIPLIGPPGRA
jgi:predicted protein tyrosine phosphatase